MSDGLRLTAITRGKIFLEIQGFYLLIGVRIKCSVLVWNPYWKFLRWYERVAKSLHTRHRWMIFNRFCFRFKTIEWHRYFLAFPLGSRFVTYTQSEMINTKILTPIPIVLEIIFTTAVPIPMVLEMNFPIVFPIPIPNPIAGFYKTPVTISTLIVTKMPTNQYHFHFQY